ncbi:MAG: hypothetical protein ACJAZO_004365 [Myxococcota bacterium]|jgi:hypothetical protein
MLDRSQDLRRGVAVVDDDLRPNGVAANGEGGHVEEDAQGIHLLIVHPLADGGLEVMDVCVR